MRVIRWPTASALGAGAAGLVLLHLSAVAAEPAATPPPDEGAAAACERAVRQSLAPQAARAVEVRFDAPPAIDATLSGEGRVVLRGAGRWRAAGGPRSFVYSCNVDPRNAEAVGLVMRDTTPRRDTPPEREPVDPDLSHLSPEACESRAAAALKRRWPNVSQISFDGGTRSLLQTGPDRTELTGQGRALPAAGMPTIHFRFECEIDPRDGRVLAARVSG